MVWAKFLVIFSSTLFHISLKLIEYQYFKLGISEYFAPVLVRGTAGDVIRYENNYTQALSSRYELRKSGLCRFEM